MRFHVSAKVLERLEWGQVLARLEGLARTPGGRVRAREPRFEGSPQGVRERLAETAEARGILTAGDRPPLGGVADLGAALGRARRGGVLSARELLELAATLDAVRDTARFLALRRERAPRLAERAAELGDLRELATAIEDALEPSGEVRDAASPALAEARRETRQLAGEIQLRLDAYLRDPETLANLSDAYHTQRNDRYVLPVRADARAGVRGIVHDASGSGATLFIEPEALVEPNNRLKRARIEVERETLRVLRELTGRAAEAADRIEADLAGLEALDLAFARGELAEQMDASEPEVGDAGVLRLPQLRHPALPPERVVPNDVRLGEGFHLLVLSGPNAGGKTVAMKAAALAALFARAGLHVPAGAGARVDLFDAILADIGDEQDIRENLSTFSAHMANLAEIVETAGERSLVVLDEVGVGTDPGEGAALAQAVLEALADRGARTIATTHYGLLKEMAEVDARFANASVEFDPETLAPTYRLRMGLPGASSATAVAARMGMPGDVIARANRLLEREDRRLDRMLADLAASRAALERERVEAARAREESEAARDQHRARLEKLQARRDALHGEMRADLERAFRAAHDEIAGVIRELQRGGTAHDAARARERLRRIQAEAREAEPAPAPVAARPARALDWRRAAPGDPVELAGGRRGVLLALPDRRGRVAVRVGGARLLLPAERIGAAEAPALAPPAARVSVETAAPETSEEPAERCDLRGLRVDEALDRLLYALDRAVASGCRRLRIVHGIGTGALRDAVRRHLAESPYVSRFAPAPPEAGGEGATEAELA